MNSGIEKALKRAKPGSGRPDAAPSKSIARITGKRGKDISRRLEAQKSLAKMEELDLLSPDELTARKIISSKSADSSVGNAFRELRGKILKEFGDEGLVISVISIEPDGGSSFVAINLAAAIAFDESKSSLVIDCNIDRQSPSQSLNESRAAIGLSDYLENDDIEAADIIMPTGIKRVRYVPVGSIYGNAAENYSSIKFQQFIDTASSRYDNRYVILDTPPILESADTSILVGLSDAVILVIPYGKVSSKQMEDALDVIGKEQIMGVVMNNEPDIGSFFGK